MASDDSEEDALAVFLMVTALEESKKKSKNESDAHGPSRGYKIYIIYRRKYNFICKHNLATNETA